MVSYISADLNVPSFYANNWTITGLVIMDKQTHLTPWTSKVVLQEGGLVAQKQVKTSRIFHGLISSTQSQVKLELLPGTVQLTVSNSLSTQIDTNEDDDTNLNSESNELLTMTIDLVSGVGHGLLQGKPCTTIVHLLNSTSLIAFLSSDTKIIKIIASNGVTPPPMTWQQRFGPSITLCYYLSACDLFLINLKIVNK